MEKCLNNLEKKIFWPIETIETDSETYEVSCDVSSKKHLFYLSGKKSNRNYQLLKCLSHAFLAENVDPLFSAIIVEGPEKMPQKVFQDHIWPVFCISRVWFADAVIIEKCPEEGKKEVRKKMDMIENWLIKGEIKPDISHVLQIALALAEGKSFSNIDEDLSGKIKLISQVFLDIDPFTPDLQKLTLLNNGLLKTLSNYSVETVPMDNSGNNIWRIS